MAPWGLHGTAVVQLNYMLLQFQIKILVLHPLELTYLWHGGPTTSALSLNAGNSKSTVLRSCLAALQGQKGQRNGSLRLHLTLPRLTVQERTYLQSKAELAGLRLNKKKKILLNILKLF